MGGKAGEKASICTLLWGLRRCLVLRRHLSPRSRNREGPQKCSWGQPKTEVGKIIVNNDVFRGETLVCFFKDLLRK